MMQEAARARRTDSAPAPGAPAQAERATEERRFAVVAAGLTVVFTLAQGVWLVLDKRPTGWDDSAYLLGSESFHRDLVARGPVAAVSSLVAASLHKAPLIMALPAPFYLMFGYGEMPAMAVQLVLMALLYAAVCGLAHRLFESRRAAAAAVFVAATMPHLGSVFREFLADGGLSTLAAGYVYFLVRSASLRRRGFGLLAGVLGGFGLLMKVTFPMYVLGPTLVLLARRLQEDRTRRLGKLVVDLAVPLAVGCVIASIWYWRNFAFVYYFATHNAFGEIGRDYGLGDVWAPATIIKYWRNAINDNFSPYYALLGAVAALLLAVRRGQVPPDAQPAQRCDAGLLLASWFALPALVLSVGENKDLRYMLPALPSFAVGLGFALDRLVRSNAAVAALLAFPVLGFILGSFVPGGVREVRAGPFVLLRVGGLMRDPWPLAEIASLVNEDASLALHTPAPKVKVCTVCDHRFLNLNNLAYAAARAGFGNLVIWTTAYLDRGIGRDEVLGQLAAYDYLVAKTGDAGLPFTTKWSAEILAALEQDRLPFRRLAEIALPDGSAALVYRNRRLDEVQQRYGFP